MAGESADDLARRQRDRAERLMQSAEHYERGAEGERRTAEVLDALSGYGYTALHDLKWPGRQRANIDHVLVGPSGVYLIDSKNWSGRVVLGQGTLKQNGYRRDRELASCGEAALALVQTLNTDVVPVLCLVRDEEISGVVQNVQVCTTANLHRLILSRRAILSPDQVQAVLMVLQGQVPGASRETAATPVAPQLMAKPPRARRESRGQVSRAPRRRPTPRKSRKRSKRQREFAGFVVSVVLMVAAYSVFISGAESRSARDSASVSAFGQSQTIAHDGANVNVSVGAPVNAKPSRAGSVKEGHRLVSVPVVIRNPGKGKWAPTGLVRWQGESSLGKRASLWSMPYGVNTGRRLPAVRAVWPGKPHRGVLVFEVPRGLRLESVSLQTTNLGGPDATWTSTGK